MNTESKVRKFVSTFVGMPPDVFTDDFDIAREIDWSKYHPDDGFGVFIEQFISRFKIKVPSQDYKLEARQRRLPKVLDPLFYFYHLFFLRQPLEISSLKVNELIGIAQSGTWTIESHAQHTNH